MKRMGQIPKLDPQVEEEIDKKNFEEDQKPLEESKTNTSDLEIHTVDLGVITNFEAKAKTETKENEENGESGGDTSRENGGGRETALPGRAVKRKSSTIY
jgi:hypothetical protein